mgnify:CR=1 FL=1
MIGIAIVLAISFSAVVYGTWLNERGERVINERMESRRFSLHGAKAAVRELRPRMTMNTVSLSSNDMADAVALIEGRIASCLAPKGSTVEQGEVIFTVENENIPLQIEEAQSNILRAESELRRAENQYKRYLLLRENDAASAQQFDDAEATWHAAQSAVHVAETKLSQLRIQESRQQVTAPIGGKVLVLYRQPGAYVQGGTALALVGDFSELFFTMSAEDKDARHFESGQEAQVVFRSKDFQKVYGTEYGAGNLGNEQKFFASVAKILPPLSEPAAMRSILWRLDNRAGLLEPQTYGEAILQSLTGRRVLTVPLSAMIDNTFSAVYVAKDGIIERRNVTTGTNDGTYIEILSGLKEGEIVVTSEVEGLTEKMQVDVTLSDDETATGGTAER